MLKGHLEVIGACIEFHATEKAFGCCDSIILYPSSIAIEAGYEALSLRDFDLMRSQVSIIYYEEWLISVDIEQSDNVLCWFIIDFEASNVEASDSSSILQAYLGCILFFMCFNIVESDRPI